MCDDPLFDEAGLRVTPAWFTHEGTSYAMRTVVRLSLIERSMPRGSWMLLFAASLVLIGFAVWGFDREGMPPWLAFALFAGSIALALVAARFAFVVRDSHRLDVVLGDGTSLVVERPGRAMLQRLHAALSRAMHYHHGRHSD